MISRPLLRWLGGKYQLAEWIVGHFPDHTIYLEPFGGAASVLLRKPRAYNEIVNDLDDDLVNLYRVLRSDDAAQLIRRLELTPYAEAEYRAALEPTSEPIERAARLIIRSHFAHGTNAAKRERPAGFRSDGRSGTTNVAGEWADYPAALSAIVERFKGVTIRCEPASALIDEYRDPKVLIYLDPPYMPATRSKKARQGGEGYHAYEHELTAEGHAALLDQISDHPAMILISGYPTDLYAEKLAGWPCRKIKARAHNNSPRVECLWMNQLCAERLSHGPLFHPRNPQDQPNNPQPGPQENRAPPLRFNEISPSLAAGSREVSR